MSGGALSQISIVLVGMSPFITASIITQLLTKAIPKLEELHKDGEFGRRKIQQWTRIVTVLLAIVHQLRSYTFCSNSSTRWINYRVRSLHRGNG